MDLDRTAPIPMSLASVSSIKGLVKSGNARIDAETRQLFSLSNVL